MKKLLLLAAAAGGVYYAHTVGYDLWTGDGWYKLYDKLSGGCSCGGTCGGCGNLSGAAAAGAAAMQPVNAVGAP